MEKLKPYLLKIRQYHFWILVLVAIVALFYAWSTGTAEIEKSFSKNKSSIKRQFADLKSKSKSRGGENFPNDKWIKKRRELTEKLKINGARAWKNILDAQRSAQTWPKTLHPDSKTEIKEDRWTDATVADYKDAAKEEIVRFRALLDAADDPDDSGILWNEVDYNNLKQSINDKDITAEDDCKLFQQILWVYEALVVAIQQTNAGAEDPFDLPVYSIKDTAVFQEASENIDESAWKLEEDISVLETKKTGGQKKPAKTGKKKRKKITPPANFQPQLRTSIGKPVALDGYEVIAFRIQVRMRIRFLEALLRSLANSPIPMIIEGIRFQQAPELKVVATSKPEASRRSLRGRRGSRGEDPQKKTPVEKSTEMSERGTLVEIWGFAYLVEIDPSAGEEDQSAQKNQTRLPASG